jgi:hypothetical protein
MYKSKFSEAINSEELVSQFSETTVNSGQNQGVNHTLKESVTGFSFDDVG